MAVFNQKVIGRGMLNKNVYYNMPILCMCPYKKSVPSRVDIVYIS